MPPLKRLTRPTAPPGLRITERDIAILIAVARFRFLTSQQIARVVGGSAKALLVRLKLLFYHALLDRPSHQHAQLAMFFDDGNRPLVYGLARKGAHLLAELGYAVDGRLDWTTKNARATSQFLAHTIEIANIMIDVAAAAGEARGLQRILCAGEDAEHAQGELIELGVGHERCSSLTLAGCFRSSDPCRAGGGVMKASPSTPCSFRNAAPFSFSRNPSMRAPARLMKTL